MNHFTKEYINHAKIATLWLRDGLPRRCAPHKDEGKEKKRPGGWGAFGIER
jgi:hypothetical protein